MGQPFYGLPRRRFPAIAELTEDAEPRTALVLRHKGDTRAAAQALAAAKRSWRDADADLPELTRATETIAADAARAPK